MWRTAYNHQWYSLIAHSRALNIIAAVLWLARCAFIEVPAVLIGILAQRLKSPVHPYEWTVWEEFVIKSFRNMWACASPLQQEVKLVLALFSKVQTFFLFDLTLHELTEAQDGVDGVIINSTQTQMLDPVDVVILYLHGGGFLVGDALMYLPAMRRIINSVENEGVSMRILSLNYSLAPQAPYPIGLEQVVKAYQWLHESSCPCKAKRYIIAGDSAGGNLALSATSILRSQFKDVPPPHGMVLISPWVDLTTTATRRMLSTRSKAVFDILSPEKLAYAAAAYVGATAGGSLNELQSPTVSPMYITDFKDWVRGYMVVLLGAAELMAEDIQAFVTRTQNTANYPVLMHPEEGMVHIWMLLWPLLGSRGLQGLDLIATHILSITLLEPGAAMPPARGNRESPVASSRVATGGSHRGGGACTGRG